MPTQHAEPGQLRPVGLRPTLRAYLRATWSRRAFLRELTSMRMHAEHSGNTLGPAWLLLTPALSAGLYYVVFGILLGARHDVPNYGLFLLVGVLLYTFFNRTVAASAKELRRQKDLVRAIPFPRMLLICAAVGLQVRQLGWTLLVIAAVAAFSVGIHLTWIAAAAGIACLILITAGAGLVVARVTAALPDAGELLPFALRAGAYLSGAYFPLAVVSTTLGTALSWNPIAVALTVARDGLAGTAPSLTQWTVLTVAAVVSGIAGVIAFWTGEPGYGRN